MNVRDQLILALDTPRLFEAEQLVNELHEHVGFFKVGLELFLANGLESFDIFHTDDKVMFDMKLLDIPETVERSLRVLPARKLIKYVTVHVGQREMVQRAAEMFENGPELLGVTVLTSMNAADLVSLGFDRSPANMIQYHVLKRVELGLACGLKGFVCSPLEIEPIRKRFGENVKLVVPGIRPEGAAVGDQKRTATPTGAIRAGATHIVVGRPIRDAHDRLAAVMAITEEIRKANGIQFVQPSL